MTELFRIFKMALPAIFSILNNVSIRRYIFFRFSKVHKRKQTSLLAKVNSRCYFLFPAAMFVPLRRELEYGIPHRPDAWTESLFIYRL